MCPSVSFWFFLLIITREPDSVIRMDKWEIEILRKKLRQVSLTSSDKLKAKLYITERWRQNLKFPHWVLGDLLFQWILSLIRSDASSILKASTMDNHLLLILMKLKLGPSNRDLSLRFYMKEEYVSKIVKTWLPKLTNIFAELIIWPEREVLRENLPACFSFFKNCACIIDCTEIYIKRPLNLNARAQTFSN